MIDIINAKCVNVEIRDDGKVLWINTENGCQLRICQIERIQVCDKRKKK
jgi:hypothetical protein